MKKVIEPEFHRPLQVDRVPATGSHEKFAADETESLAVAARLGINAVESLSAHLKALPWRGGVQITGTVKATVNQNSVVSLEPFESELSFQVERYFMPPKATVPRGRRRLT